MPDHDPLADVAALPGVDDAVDAARTAVDALRGHQLLRRRAADVATEMALRGARASAALDGVVWTLDEVRAVDRRRRAGAGVVYGALRAVAAVPELSRPFERAPRQVFARLHALAGAGLTSDQSLGRPRDGDSVEDALGLGDPMPAPMVTVRLDGLAGLLTGPTAAPAVVTAAVAHGELLAMRPFVTANGVVARATTRLVLRSRGLDPTSLAAPELGHLQDRGAYADAARGYVAGGAAGVAAWVVHCATAVETGAREALAVCQALLRG